MGGAEAGRPAVSSTCVGSDEQTALALVVAKGFSTIEIIKKVCVLINSLHKKSNHIKDGLRMNVHLQVVCVLYVWTFFPFLSVKVFDLFS